MSASCPVNERHFVSVRVVRELRLPAVGCCLVVLALPSLGSDVSSSGTKASDLMPDVRAMAGKIDRPLADEWVAAKVEPAARAEDAEFLRRVYLDLAGRIPSVAEARAFLRDTSPDRRERLVERLLAGPRYVTHFANFWRAVLLPEVSSSIQARYLAPGFEGWLRAQLAKNAGYDKIVREILTATIDRQVYAFPGQEQSTPIAFFLAKELKPENVAAAVTRVFMGVRLECAQCHNHPFADWTREQFWGFAAFFAGIKSQNQGDFTMPASERLDTREMVIPGTERVVQACFLDGSEPRWKFKVSPRQTLADWLVSPRNSYFARATVNRLWAYFLGAGLIEPVDEMIGTKNTVSHPDLLAELARDFADHQFDLKYLIRVITSTRAYQLSSAAPSLALRANRDVQQFARMPLRGMSPEQIFDSVGQAIGYRDAGLDPRFVFIGTNTPRGEFLTAFADQGNKATDAETSIPQALLLLNGKLIADATSLEKGLTLAAVADAPFLTTPQRIEALFLASLSRQPRRQEQERFASYVNNQPDAAKRQEALADVFWTLLNSAEFVFNH